jgi:hypothetical protein
MIAVDCATTLVSEVVVKYLVESEDQGLSKFELVSTDYQINNS